MPTRITIATYDEKHKQNLAKRAKKVSSLYDAAVKRLTQAAAPSLFDADKEQEFHFEDFPTLKREMDALMQDLYSSLQTNIEDGDEESWTLANTKNDAMVESVIGKAKLPKQTVQAWKHPHLEALNAFIDRKEAGMGLSKRVWNLTQQFKDEMELALELGMGEGKSAAELSRDIRKYLKEPNKLFRRVRDKSGALRLSKAAAAYHPGRGVYRSSYKNALRMTATENNMAYRTADHTRWQALPFVIGIEIHISNNHPTEDICDLFDGKRFPKDFKFTGWHPWCRCYAVSILAKQEEMDAYIKALIAGEDVSDWQFTSKVEQMPTEFTKWMKDNESRIAKAKSMPYFIKDNFKDGDPAKGLRWEGKNKQSAQWEPSFMNEEQYTELTRTMKITPEQHHELYDGDDVYIDSSWSRQINKELASEKVRGDIPDNFMDGDTGTIRQCKVLDAVIKANTLKEDTYVYRKVTEDWLKRDGVSFTEGNVIHEFGYTPFSNLANKASTSFTDASLPMALRRAICLFVNAGSVCPWLYVSVFINWSHRLSYASSLLSLHASLISSICSLVLAACRLAAFSIITSCFVLTDLTICGCSSRSMIVFLPSCFTDFTKNFEFLPRIISLSFIFSETYACVPLGILIFILTVFLLI
jgi:hypothetical protein